MVVSEVERVERVELIGGKKGSLPEASVYAY